VLKQFASDNTVTAVVLGVPLDGAGFPPAAAWAEAAPVHFDHDWRGENADPERATTVRVLYTPSVLYLRFVARFRVITVFDDAESTGRRDHLWDRDVAEAFLQPHPAHLRHYKEFEVSPNGFWIDLDINNGERQDLQSGLQRRVSIDQAAKSWTADLAIPMKSLCSKFDPAITWRVNFYRAEGVAEPRFYSAWRPTLTPQPNFHVPELFGYLRFAS
jgi:alpha-galactosidase